MLDLIACAPMIGMCPVVVRSNEILKVFSIFLSALLMLSRHFCVKVQGSDFIFAKVEYTISDHCFWASGVGLKLISLTLWCSDLFLGRNPYMCSFFARFKNAKFVASCLLAETKYSEKSCSSIVILKDDSMRNRLFL